MIVTVTTNTLPRLAATALLVCLCQLVVAACGTHAPSGDLLDVDGRPVAASLGSAATVLVFLATDCPISTRYLPELAGLRVRFADAGVVFEAIYPGAGEHADEVRSHAAELGSGFLALRDPQHVLVARVDATVTPEAAVLDRSGVVVYRGRIDDQFVDFGKARAAATRHELADAIEAVLAGKPPAPASGPPIGCGIADSAQ
jgi:hypothetical protein